MKIYDPTDTQWLLLRIQRLNENPNRLATHRDIWAGSYDVWHSVQDQVDAVEIPKARMEAARTQGLIESEIIQRRIGEKVFNIEVWRLTPAGEEILASS